MKIVLLSFIGFVVSLSANSQNLGYEVFGCYNRSVKKDRINKAISIGDITPNYPTAWIKNSDYVSSKIEATYKGQIKSALGINDTLSKEQKLLLINSVAGMDLKFLIHYKNKNSVTEEISVRTIDFVLTIVPNTEAEFSEGSKQLNAYLFQNAIEKISLEKDNLFEKAVVKFQISKTGEIVNPFVLESSNDEEIDILLLDVVSKMPKWKPAVNWNGENISQDFELHVGYLIGC